MQGLTGIGLSTGLASGPAVVLVLDARLVRFALPGALVPEELIRLEQARDRSRTQLESIRAHVAGTAGAEMGSLFDAQLLMLDDPMFFARASSFIRERRINAEWALQQVFDDLSSVLEEVHDPYLRERQGDVADVLGRLRMNLRRANGPPTLFRGLETPSILVADELTPSIVAQLDWSRIRAFATDAGSRTSHTAILARSLNIPAVVGLHDASTRVTPGSLVIVDANAGVLILDPTAEMLETVARYSPAGRSQSPRVSSRGPSVTHDGVRVRLEANVEMLDDLTAAREQGAEGIGLYRTEFLLASSSLESLTEDVQYETYRRLIEGMAPHPVTIRTFDVDEDQLDGIAPEDLTRPAILPEHGRSRFGLRGVRLSVRRRELMKTQLRALLRSGRHGSLRIVFPFVSGIEELREARGLMAEAATELGARGQTVLSIPVGAMIEVPSAALTADLLAREADFFTIGTNDLIQCCLAVDRTDERVSHLYEPLHPAILRLIRQVRRAASRQRIPVAVCGEMASDPAVLPLLVGFGLTEFSMTPAALPAARQVISEMRAGDLRRIALNALKLTTAAEIERYLATELAARSVERVGAGDRRGGEA